MKLSVAPRATRQSVLIFGPPKTGKTKLVSELAKQFKLIWFDLENGHETLFQLPPEFHDNIELINIRDTRSFPIAIETMLKVIKGGPLSICEEHGKVDCALCKKAGAAFVKVHLNELDNDTVVVVDSVTQLTNSAIAHITKDKPDDYKLDYDDWGNLGKLMEIFLSHVQQAKFNIVCITHETEAVMEDDKVKIVPTAGTRNFSRNSAKYFGHVVYAEVKTLKHKFTSSTTATLNIVAGSRTNIALEKMNEPSLASIFTTIAPTSRSISSDTGGVQKVGEKSIVGDGNTSNTPAQTNGEVAATKLSGLAAQLAARRAEQGK